MSMKKKDTNTNKYLGLGDDAIDITHRPTSATKTKPLIAINSKNHTNNIINTTIMMTKVLLQIITIFATLCTGTGTGTGTVSTDNSPAADTTTTTSSRHRAAVSTDDPATVCDLTGPGDPSTQWVTYVKYITSNEKRITSVSSKWTVPAPALTSYGSSRADKNIGAPGFWMGIQSTNGKGALIQPVLAYGPLDFPIGCFERNFTDDAENELYNCAGYPGAGYTCDDDESPNFCAGDDTTISLGLGPNVCAKKIPGSIKLDPVTNKCERPVEYPERYGGTFGVYNIFNVVFDWCLGLSERVNNFFPQPNE